MLYAPKWEQQEGDFPYDFSHVIITVVVVAPFIIYVGLGLIGCLPLAAIFLRKFRISLSQMSIRGLLSMLKVCLLCMYRHAVDSSFGHLQYDW
jgi:hypothetical protein